MEGNARGRRRIDGFRFMRTPLDSQRLARLDIDRGDQVPVVAHIDVIRHRRMMPSRQRQ